ncbi:MAG: PEP-CTERM sorting domain-containing protein [Burkholderiales bacterium]|nr:PEP-CTERM sorting domain-containing protein [Burkholderiales bacterium]
MGRPCACFARRTPTRSRGIHHAHDSFHRPLRQGRRHHAGRPAGPGSCAGSCRAAGHQLRRHRDGLHLRRHAAGRGGRRPRLRASAHEHRCADRHHDERQRGLRHQLCQGAGDAAGRGRGLAVAVRPRPCVHGGRPHSLPGKRGRRHDGAVRVLPGWRLRRHFLLRPERHRQWLLDQGTDARTFRLRGRLLRRARPLVPVPEPASALLLVAGLAALSLRRLRTIA